MALVALLFKANSEDEKEDEYRNSLMSAGYNAQCISPIDFEFCNEVELFKCLQSPSAYSGLILSSPRCVKAIAQVSKIHNAELTSWSHLPCFVVGESTDNLARDLGFKTEGKESGNATRLGEFIAKKTLSKPLLYPTGSLTKDTLRKQLEKSGISVDIQVVYKTLPHPHLESAISNIVHLLPTIIVFFSPSGVESVLPYFTKYGIKLHEQNVIAIGPTTEKCLEDLGIAVSAVCEKPTPEALVHSVKSVSLPK